MAGESTEKSAPEALRGAGLPGAGSKGVPWRLEGLPAKGKSDQPGGGKRRWSPWVWLVVLYLGFFLIYRPVVVRQMRGPRKDGYLTNSVGKKDHLSLVIRISRDQGGRQQEQSQCGGWTAQI